MGCRNLRKDMVFSFKKHVIKYDHADHEAAKKFIDKFGKIIADENLTSEQFFNSDEISLFWHYCPTKTMTTADESLPTGIKDAMNKISVLECANAAGTHKCKLATGKSLHPHCFKGVNFLPVHYYATFQYMDFSVCFLALLVNFSALDC